MLNRATRDSRHRTKLARQARNRALRRQCRVCVYVQVGEQVMDMLVALHWVHDGEPIAVIGAGLTRMVEDAARRWHG